MAKPEKQKKAREMRKQGQSVTGIAKKLGVAKSSVSKWTRDIVLTPEQEANLRNSNERRKAQKKGARANVRIHREKRIRYQDAGRAKAREGDPLHLAGCMLYWAEGKKSRSSVSFVNSDVNMMVFFIHFLRESLKIKEEKISFRIIAYLGNGLTEDDIITYWMEHLQLTEENRNKCRFNDQPASSKQRGRKLLYGVCEVTYSSTELMQGIYGAIQEYAGFDYPDWLDIP